MTELAPVTSGFMVIHGNRMEDLRDLMLSWCASHPLPPLIPEVFLVQSNGMKQWLTQSIAKQRGVCAATEVYLPSAFLWQVYRQVLGNDAVPTQMPFDKAPLTWRIMRLLHSDCAYDKQTYAAILHYLSTDDTRQQKSYQLAQHIADLYDQYQSYRADWITDWSNGCDQLIDCHGITSDLSTEQKWQAALWRLLQADITKQGLGDASRARVHADFMHKMHTLQHVPALPKRIIVFGISSMPMQMLEALSILGNYCQVLLFVHNPCQYYWGDVQEARYLLTKQLKQAQLHRVKNQQTLSALDTDYASAHPLLALWGKQGKDYIQHLTEFDDTAKYAALFRQIDLFLPARDNSLLSQVQNSILMLDSPPKTPLPLPINDTSICFRSAYSTQREVEILHDHLLALFDGDTQLTPSDVIVMVPEIDQFSAAVNAVFGRFQSNTSRYIPYSIADNSSRIEPMLQLLTWLLTLPTAEITLSDWHSMFEIKAVRDRFALTENEVSMLHDWLRKSGVRWGIDAKDRSERFALPNMIHTTSWLFGLERLLLGYAMGEDKLWQNVASAEFFSGLSANLLGGLQQWLVAIRSAQSLLKQPLTPALWGVYLNELLVLFFDDHDDLIAQSWLKRFRDALSRWLSDCEAANFHEALPLSVVSAAWLAEIDTPNLQRPFLTGGVQFATLMPMRAIPFKVICLLGMNEGDYPRQQIKSDFDLMASATQWRAGDRSRRHDDRYLFLEAMLSARKQFYISWTGKDINDDTPRSPSILVTQLRHYLSTVWQPELPIIQHPLQPFSQDYLAMNSDLRTYDENWMHSVQVTNTEKMTRLLNEHVLPTKPIPNPLTMQHLRTLLRHPQQVYLRQRLQVTFNSVDETNEEDEAFTITGLENYQLQSKLVSARVKGDVHLTAQLNLTGVLPLAAFSDPILRTLTQQNDTIYATFLSETQGYHVLEASPIPLTWSLGAQQLQASLPFLFKHEVTGQFLAIEFYPNAAMTQGKLKGCVLINSWLNHLYACALDYPLTSKLIASDGVFAFFPLPKNEAIKQLQTYIELYNQAWHQPLAVGCKTAISYLQALAKTTNDKDKTMDQPMHDDALAEQASFIQLALSRAEGVFSGNFNLQGEWASCPYMQRCFSDFSPFAQALPDLAEPLYGLMLKQVVCLS